MHVCCKVENDKCSEAQIKLAWKQVDWDEFGVFFENTNWDELLTPGLDADQLWNNFSNKLDEGIKLFVPVARPPKSKEKAYHKKSTIRLIRKKKRFGRFRKTSQEKNGKKSIMLSL
jgi:hypothetical protein